MSHTSLPTKSCKDHGNVRINENKIHSHKTGLDPIGDLLRPLPY